MKLRAGVERLCVTCEFLAGGVIVIKLQITNAAPSELMVLSLDRWGGTVTFRVFGAD